MAKQSISERALAVQHTPTTVTVGNLHFKSTKQAVVPTLRQKGDIVVAFTVLEKMRVGKQMPPDKQGNVMPRATLVRVRSLQNQRIYDYVVPAILASTWVDEYDGGTREKDGTITKIANGELKGYPDFEPGTHTYVGKSFVVQKGVKPDGQRYRDIEAQEIDPNEVIEQPA